MLTPLLHAPAEIQIHVAAALMATGLAPVQFLRRRRDRLHKAIGYLWVLAMAATAVSSFWLQNFRVIGPFSPIHLLSAYVLVALWRAIAAARRGDIARHRTILGQTATGALGIAGLFTLLPGRLMNEAIFPGWPVAGFLGALATVAAIALLVQIRTRRWTPGQRFG